MKKCRFDDIEETQLLAGFFVSDVCKKLGISERSWYRWKSQGVAPYWAFVALKLLAGSLDHLGWRGWYIEQGVLYTRLHSEKLYNWRPGELARDRFLSLQKSLYSLDSCASANDDRARKRAGERRKRKRGGELPYPRLITKRR